MSDNLNYIFFKLLIKRFKRKVLRVMYLSTKHCIDMNAGLTDWSPTEPVLKQGDNLPPTLWNMFLNDLLQVINDLKVGIHIYNTKFSILQCAHGMVRLVVNERNIQALIQKLDEFCMK